MKILRQILHCCGKSIALGDGTQFFSEYLAMAGIISILEMPLSLNPRQHKLLENGQFWTKIGMFSNFEALVLSEIES